MTITPSVKVSDGNLFVKGRKILSSVPNSVVTSSAVSSVPVDGVFIGAEFSQPACRHVVSLGVLRDVRFMATFRFKLWWMSQKMGQHGGEVPNETQFLLIESKPESINGSDESGDVVYVVFLPLVEGAFRSCLQGGAGENLELCIESGDTDILSSSFSNSLFVGAASNDPFTAITGAVRAVKSHTKTFRQRFEKRLPSIVDYFGWCTWDAFYQEVTQEGVEAGLHSLTTGGAPPKFVIIDDGWQSVGVDQGPNGEPSSELLRLTGIKENNKFKSKASPSDGIRSIVAIAKEKYNLKYVYVWHAITGYWGGVRPGKEFNSKMQYPKISPGVMSNEPTLETELMTKQGLGLVSPKSVYKFYNDLHSYLAAAGVDGVKVDGQCVLETLGAGLGGRVELTRQYHQALDASIAKNFHDNGIIACMSHNTDALYCSKQTAIVRASDDFFPRDPISHTIHIASVAYNSIFLGEFMLPDWDMFHSLHPAAEYHASARAISGGPFYVSDAPRKHNFELLRKLVLPDGSILRARLPGRPTKDCLFTDPARDGKNLLKIWNMNKFTGVLGVYNCQGTAWSATEKKNAFHHTETRPLSCTVKGTDVHLIAEAATERDWNSDCAVYSHKSGELAVLPNDAAIPVSLKVLELEIYTMSPIKVLAPGYKFAPIGLIDMYNAGGAIEGITYHILAGAKLIGSDSSIVNVDDSARPVENKSTEPVAMVCMEVKGRGRFGAYCSSIPRKCSVNVAKVEFSYNASMRLLMIQLDSMPSENSKVHKMIVELSGFIADSHLMHLKIVLKSEITIL